MNDDPDKPLNPVGDDALEARLTAWVLGEASPFEAAELEELCARDPEARLFVQRLRVLHGLIAADGKAGPDEEWKLPAEKRAKIEALFGEPVEEAQPDPEPEKIVSIRRTGRRALMALAACTVISVGGWAFLTSTGEFSKEAVAMQVEADASAQRASRKGQERALEELRKAIIAQEDAVEDKRKLLEAIIRSEAIVYADGQARPNGSRGSNEELEAAAGKFNELEQEKIQLASQIETLLKYDGPQLMNYAAGLSLPDNVTSELLPRYQEAKRELEALKTQGLAENHPELKGKAAQVSGMEADLYESVANLRSTLASRLKLAKDQSTQLQARIKESERRSISQGIANQSFVDAKADYESNLRILEQLKLKGISEEIRLKGTDAAIAFNETPATPTAPMKKPAEAPGQLPSQAPFTPKPGLAAQPAEPAIAGRRTGPAAAADGFADGSDFSNLGEMAELAESVDAGQPGQSDSYHFALGATGTPDVALGIESLDDLGRKESELGRPLDANALDTRRWFSRDEGVKSEVGATALMDGPTEAPGYSGLAQKEMVRRQDAVTTSDKLRDEGRAAYTKGDYKLAVDRFRESLDVLPDAEMVQDRRDYLGTLFADGATALGEQYRKVGKYDEARQLADDALAVDKDSAEAKKLAGFLDDPIRTNPALNFEHTGNTDELRRKLYLAEGNYNLGKFDDANRAYEEALRIDPYNKAARRGMESVAQARQDYYRAAYDQTRAQLLTEVDGETPVPSPVAPAAEQAGASDDMVRAQLLAEVDKAWDLAVPPVDAPAQRAETKKEMAKPVVVESVAETLTSAEPFSTFSLHVSDASFKLAKAALERGEVPAAESIRPEEFYNAFDYGDPAPGHGEPVACAVEQSAHPAIPQRNLLRIGVKTGSQGRGGSTPLHLTLLLDSSGSMEREDRTAGLANAVKQLSGLLKEGDTISVIGFARQPRLLADRLPGARAQELNALIAQTPSEGGTNLEEGLKLGEELALRQFNPAAQNRVVLFTDGAANLGDAMPETLQAKVEAMRQKGIAFDAAGFGADGLNDKLLERLTRNGNGRYYVVDDAADADANFAKQLAGAFRPAAENVKVQVRFNPARVAKYKLIGFEEHRLNKEDFRNDAVDAAEMAAEEAGNALYQIETLPQGEGEVGEVSVRFRDAASGQMVERTWTIPYEAQAPAFDQAKPSLQLAGLAAFAAEKLRAAPLADAIDFQQLAPVLAKVKARYPDSRPVAELEAMIGKLK